MHKKDALKRKKLINQIRHRRDMLDGRVLTADGRETLLGNLAPVRHIPMLPWKRVLVFPTSEKTITVTTGEENAWLYRLLEDISKKAHDLVGFTPVKELHASGYEDVGVGTVGIAVQVQKIEPPENGKAIVHLKGICRYENTGFLPSDENNFSINVRWFEDNREADSIVRPQYEESMRIIERMSKAAGDRMRDYFNVSKTIRYNYTAAQYFSFILIDGFSGWFSMEEQLEMLRCRPTSARLKKITERSLQFLPEIENRMKKASSEK